MNGQSLITSAVNESLQTAKIGWVGIRDILLVLVFLSTKFFKSIQHCLTHLAVIHLGLHHPLHVLFLHSGGHTKAVAHAQDFRPAIWVRHLH